MEYYLCISIGPVQDFIAAARRCRDLWFGSYLLSEVSKAAAKGLLDAGVPLESLIFPAPDKASDLRPDSALNVANRVVALVKDPQRAVKAAKDSCQRRLQDLAKLAFKEHSDNNYFNLKAALAQLEDLLEFYWVACPTKNASSSYRETRRLAEKIMAARKNSRLFSQVTWAAPVDKSSLDGQRECVLDVQKMKSNDPFAPRRWGLRDGEKLCGIGALKRLGSMHKHYRSRAALSTSHVASGPWVRMNRLEGSAALKEFESQLKEIILDEADLKGHNGQLDGHLFYEERLLTYVGEEHHNQARLLLHDLWKSAKGQGPSPYYTILLADGDRMGATIDALDLRQHRELTRALSIYATQKVEDIIKAHHGYLIYSGGDDILALLPVDLAVECATNLATTFKQQLSNFGSLTLSVGLAIRHHLDPLREGLTAARRAEKKAKETRDSLAISLDKRGGSEILVAGRWGEIEKRLVRYVSWLPRLATGFAYELRNLSDRLQAEDNSTTEELVLKEAMRIAQRKAGPEGELTSSELKQLEEDIKLYTPRRIADELVVSRFLSAHGSLQAKKE